MAEITPEVSTRGARKFRVGLVVSDKSQAVSSDLETVRLIAQGAQEATK